MDLYWLFLPSLLAGLHLKEIDIDANLPVVGLVGAPEELLNGLFKEGLPLFLCGETLSVGEARDQELSERLSVAVVTMRRYCPPQHPACINKGRNDQNKIIKGVVRILLRRMDTHTNFMEPGCMASISIVKPLAVRRAA